MANQTVTTALNYDAAAISGLVDGDTVTITGGTLTIDADVRWNQQAAVFGAITLSTSGGALTFDGTQIWEVPFSASSGNVPTQAALGSNGVTGGTSGATGELTRVWASGSLTPATAGGAMPTAGFIKLRSKTGTFQSGETITLPGGATVTASGAGKRSWVHIVARGATTGSGSRLTIPRLASFNATGDWYELGTTDGTDNQTFQYPVADQCPAIWIETTAGSGTYEIWLNALDRWTDGAVATGDKRGMYFACNATTGVITIAARGANNAGLKPPTGCKVRVPNLILSNADGTTPAYSTNILPAALSSRYSFVTTNAGSFVLDKVACNWYATSSSAFLVSVTNCSFGTVLSFSNVGTTSNVENVGIGIVDTNTGAQLIVNTNFGGGNISDVFAAKRIGASSGFVFDVNQSANFTFTRCRADAFGASGTNAPASSSSGFSAVRSYNFTYTDCSSIGSIAGLAPGPCAVITATNFKYASRTVGTTQTTDLGTGININIGTTDALIDGYSNFDGLANVHPYSQLVLVANSSSRVEIRNIGTAASPYNMGTVNPCGYAVGTSISLSITLRRVYVQNERTSLIQSNNTVTGLQIYNAWGTTTVTQAIATNSATIRGVRYLPSTVGQAAVYGTHWADVWTSTTAGRIIISCNEPAAETASQCTASLSAADGSGFNSAGSVAMKAATDEVTWTMPYFALGVTGFSNSAPTITGTNAANHTLDFQYDLNDGTGFNGTWLTLNGTNLSAITVDPTKGVKLTVRAKVNTAAANNQLTYISIATTTTSTAQQIEYPFPGAIVNVNSLVSGSRVKITRVDTGALLAQDSTAGTSIPFDVPYSGAVRIEARKATSAPFYKPWVTQATIATGSTTNITALQEQD